MHRRVRSVLRVLLAALLGAAVSISAAPGAGAGNDPRFGEQWAFPLIGAPTAWSVATGSGITIAVVDTGVDFGHEDLKGKVLRGHNFVTPTTSAQDDNGHGTHVAGTAGAATGNGVGVAGTAPGASILPVKVLGANGRGSVDDISEGIKWAADSGAHVINLSLGPNAVVGALFGNGLDDEVKYAWSRGSIVVIAAGNNFMFSSSARDVPAIVVTATSRDDRKAGYASEVGPVMWGMAAPGGAGGFNEADDILSTHWKERSTNAYENLAGTSMAAPHVAGAAAILRGMGLSPQQTVDRLLRSAKDLGAAGPDTTFGAGRLDVACAVGRCGNTVTATTSATSPPPGEGDSGGGQTAGTSGSGSSQPQEPSRSGSAPAPTGPSGGSGGSAAPAANSDGGASAASGAGGTAAGPAPTGSSGAGARSVANRTSGLAALLRRGAPAPAVPPTGPNPPTVPAAPTDVAAGETVASEPTGGDIALDAPRPAGLTSSPRGPAGDERPRRALVAAACGLLILIAFSGLKLRRSLRR